MIKPFCFLFILSSFLIGCSLNSKDYTPGEYSLENVEKIKLTDEGKRRAQTVWDSLIPLLRLSDSTTTGYVYSSMDKQPSLNSVEPYLEFDYDTIMGPRELKLYIDFQKGAYVPETSLWVGDERIFFIGRVKDLKTKRQFSDSVGVSTERAVKAMIAQKGMRFDTDRGPTTGISESTSKSLQQALTAYYTGVLLHNPLNRNQY